MALRSELNEFSWIYATVVRSEERTFAAGWRLRQ